MNILLVSWHFPPFNAIGGVRVGKLAKYLSSQGFGIRVLCGSPHDIPTSLAVEIPSDAVIRPRWFDVNWLPNTLIRLTKPIRSLARRETGAGQTVRAETAGAAPEVTGNRTPLQTAVDTIQLLLNFPDGYVGWVPDALRRGLTLPDGWRPDLIYASGPPFIAFLVGRILAGWYRVPWIAEFRDRWVDDPYAPTTPVWRRRLLSGLERRLIASAWGIVTVSDPWAEAFRTKFGKPVLTALNGFDPVDFPPPAGVEAPLDPEGITIVYTGVIYRGRRDPTPLFQALALLGEDRDKVKVRFVGTDPDDVLPLAAQAGVADLVSVTPRVPYRDSIQLQRRAEALLLLQWNNPREQGNCPAKLFEYLAVRRPILGIGYEEGVPATIIRERQAGTFSNDPEILAEAIRHLVAIRRRGERVPLLPPEVCAGFERDQQFARLDAFFAEAVADRPRR